MSAPLLHTAAPWDWVEDGQGRVRLATPDRGRLIVMDFARKGMQGAEPRFAAWCNVKAGSSLVPHEPRERRGGILLGVGEIMAANGGLLQHPDALVIKAAPLLLEAAVKALTECVDLVATPAGDALERAVWLATRVPPLDPF